MTGFEKFLCVLERHCEHLAAERFAPGDRVPPSWSAEADAYVRRLEAHGAEEFEPPSPECAAALLPRLSLARPLASLYEEQMRAAEAEPRLLEGLLITRWRDVLEAVWVLRS